MSPDPHFAPVLSQHAIERCAAAVGLKPALPEKAFVRLIEAAAKDLETRGFSKQVVSAFGVEVGPDGQFKALAPSPNMPQAFGSSTRSEHLTISPEGFNWTSSSYVRWQPFIGGFEQIVLPFLTRALETVSVNAVKLEYWDRFYWSGNWSNFDPSRLLKKSDYAAGLLGRPREWHSHVGWFEPIEAYRRLVNVNIDVVEMTTSPDIAPRPSIGIYSSLTDQANVSGYGETPEQALNERFVIERLEAQHLALKEILGHIITDEMSNRIGLFSRTSPNARP